MKKEGFFFFAVSIYFTSLLLFECEGNPDEGS